MTDTREDSEIKAYNLHVEYGRLLDRYRDLIRETNSEPTFGEDYYSERGGKVLYDNRPLADWEPPTPPLASDQRGTE